MSIYDEVQILREVPPFAKLDEKKLRLLAFVSDLVSFHAGETIMKQGDQGDAVFVLVDGLIDVTIEKKGAATMVREMGRHAFFGEIAVMHNTVRAATVKAKTNIIALKISKRVLHEMIESEPKLAERIEEHIDKAGYAFS